jgi:hypothetical protein
MAADTTTAPRFDVADSRRNWYFVSDGSQRFVEESSPYDIVYYMQLRLGVRADGNWGTGTSDRLLAYMRETNAPAPYIAAVEAVKQSRSFAGPNGLIAWTIAIYLSRLPTNAQPNWAAIQSGAIALGTNATLPQVTLPTYGREVPGSPTRTATQAPRSTPAPAATPPSAPMPQPDVSAVAGTLVGTAGKNWKTIAIAIFIVVALGLLAVAFLEENSGKRGSMSIEEARRVLGVGPTATPDEIRAAWRRRTFSAAPGKDGRPSPEFARVNLAYETLTKQAAPRSTTAIARSNPTRANPAHLKR